MSVSDVEKGYPPPAPPTTKKTDLLAKHSKEFRQANDTATTAATELNNSLEDLVKHLVSNATCDLQKVRTIFIWLSRQNFLKGNNRGRKDETTPGSYLNLIALKKKSLVDLFVQLCRLAGMPCKVLSGYCKKEGDWTTGSPGLPTINSSWAAVHFDGQWGFVHLNMAFAAAAVTWSKHRKVEKSGHRVQECTDQFKEFRIDEEFFLPDPDLFIYMCRPQQDAWQLLKGPQWTWSKFINAPNRRPRTPSPPRAAPQPSRPESPTLEIPNLSAPDFENHYPPPAPPRTRKSDIVGMETFPSIDRMATQSTPEERYRSYETLFDHLFQSLDSDVKKVRALLMWLSVNCSYTNIQAKLYKKATDPNTPIGAVKLTIQGRLSLEMLFAVLCRQAGLPCVVIKGQKKRAGLYKLGQFNTNRPMFWNAVYLDGDWRFINVDDTLHHLDYKEEIVVNLDGRRKENVHITWSDKITEFFFLTDPDEMVHFCFPDNDRWQLLDSPFTQNQFFGEPWIHPPYFLSRIKLRPDCSVSVLAKDGFGQVLLDDKDCQKERLYYSLYYCEEGEKVWPEDPDMNCFITFTRLSEDPPTRSLFFTLPVKGTYMLELTNESEEALCKFSIQCTGHPEKNSPFPGSPDIGFGFLEIAKEVGLEEASRKEGMVVAREGDRVRFQFKTSAELARKWPSVTPGEKCPLRGHFLTGRSNQVGTEKHVNVIQAGDRLHVDATVPFGNKKPHFALQLSMLDDDHDIKHLMKYLVTSDTKIVAAAANVPPARQTELELEAATEDDDLDRLEVAMRELRYSGLVKELQGKQLEAQLKLMTLHKTACQTADAKGDVKALESAIMAAHQSIVAYYIHRAPWFELMEKKLRLLKRTSAKGLQRIHKVEPKQDQVQNGIRVTTQVQDTEDQQNDTESDHEADRDHQSDENDAETEEQQAEL